MKVTKQSQKTVTSTGSKSDKKKTNIGIALHTGKLVYTLATIMAVLAALCYIQTIGYEFALDDYSVIKENRITKQGTEALGTIFKTTYRYGYTIQGDELYRPIPKAIYAIFWQYFPDNAFPGHLLNILCYAFTGFILMITLSRIMHPNVIVPFIATAIFVVHPIHTEVVANIKSLDEILGMMFFIVSLYFMHSYMVTQQLMKMVWSTLFYFIALMSKESAITFLAVYPLVFYFWGNHEIIKTLKVTAVLLIPALLFLLIRHNVIGMSGAGEVSPADNLLMATTNIVERKATAIVIMGMYLKLLVAPITLAFDYSYNQIPIVGAGNWKFLLSLVVLVSMVVFAVMGFKKKNIAAFGIIYFFVTSSLSSNLVMIIGTSLGERLMYAPSLGICLVLAYLIYELGKKIKPYIETSATGIEAFFKSYSLPIGITALLCVAYTIKTIAQNPVWTNNLTLYESGVKVSPNSTRTQFYLGNAITKDEYLAKFNGDSTKIKAEMLRGIELMKKSIALYPQFTDPWTQIGVAYYKLKDYGNAYKYYEEALKVSPHVATIHNNMGTLMFDTGQYENAAKAFEKAIALDPGYSDAYNNAGSAYGTMQQFGKAIEMFRKCTELDPRNEMAWRFLGITYQSIGNTAEAKRCSDIAAGLKIK